MIRDYPTLQIAYAEIRQQSVTANMSGMPHGGQSTRTVESIAIRQLPEEDQKVYDAVTTAVEITRLLPAAADRMRLIKMMYWSGHNMPAKDAAVHIPCAEITAKRWHGDFVRLVGRCYGFKDDTPEPK